MRLPYLLAIRVDTSPMVSEPVRRVCVCARLLHMYVVQSRGQMDNSTSNVFGSMLKELRERRNLTQKALGYKIGKKSRGSIQAWESGHHLPKERETVLALARALSPLTSGEVDRLLLAAHHAP